MRELDFNLQVILTPKQPLHKHMSCEVVLVLRGTLEVSLDGNLSVLQKDDILFIGSENEHYLSGKTEDTLVCTLTISPEICWHLTGVYCDSTQIADLAAFSNLRRIMKQLLLNRQSGRAQDNYFQLSLCFRLLHILETYFRTEQTDDDIAVQLKQYIFKNYRDEINLQTMADYFHFSVAYLSRMIKKKLGITFLAYLSALRIERAAEEILYTDKGITDIAMEQGFSSLSSFYKQFDDKYGMPPQEYRKTNAPEKRIHAEDDEKSNQFLREYLEIEKPKEQINAGFEHNLILDSRQRKHGRLNMTGLINIGPITNFSNQSVQEAVKSSSRYLGSRRLRAIISMNPQQAEEKTPPDFSVLESLLRYCSQERMIPYLVILFDDKVASWQHGQFISAFKEFADSLIWEAVMCYSSDLSICFELKILSGRNVETVRIEYLECFKYLKHRVNRYYPHGIIGGAGTVLSDFAGKEEAVLTAWAESVVLPDFFSVSLFSYTRLPNGTIHQFSDSGNIIDLLEKLNTAAKMLSLDNIPIYVTEFDSFKEENNYFNDSRWKACFVLKTYAECLDKVSFLGYIKLKDHRTSITTNRPFYGENGALTAENLQKPLFNAFRALRGIGQDIIFAGKGCILSRVTPFRFRAVLFNYKPLNDLFFLKNSGEIAPEDLNLYIENLENESFHIELDNLTDGEYQVNSYTTNEQYGSALDIWIRKGCPDSNGLRKDWLYNYSFPDISSKRIDTVAGSLKLDFVLRPLDFIGLEIFLVHTIEN